MLRHLGTQTAENIGLRAAMSCTMTPREGRARHHYLGELFAVLTRKSGRSRTAARSVVARWMAAYDVIPTSADILDEAFELAQLHEVSGWDAVVLAAAAQAHCRYLLSEDFQNGFVWRGVTLVNPFAEQATPLPLAAILVSPPSVDRAVE